MPAEDTIGEAAKILPMDETIQGIASTNPRSFGAGIGPHLLAAAFGEQSSNVKELKEELHEVRLKLDVQSAELTQCKIEKGQLLERVDNMESARKLRNIVATLAAIMLSIGLKLAGTTQSDFGWVLMIFGVVLLVVSWFVGGPKKK